jgi:glycosyltransferase involved in cell wall biosynthesis
LRVAYLNHGLYYGGATASLYLLLKSLEGRGVERRVFATSCRSEEMRSDFLKYALSVERVRLPQVHYNQAGRSPLHRFWMARLFPCLSFARRLSALGADILHVNTTVFPTVLGWVKGWTRAKVVVHVRELLPDYERHPMGRYLAGQILRHADAIVAISDNEAAPFRGHPRLAVMPNPFDFSVVDRVPGGFRAANGLPEDAVLVGMMGQFHRGKGHLDFLRAARILAAEPAGARLLFVMLGVPPAPPAEATGSSYWREVRALLEDRALAGRVRTFPYVYDVFPAAKALDIIVRPSVSGDPWGRDVIEAMALGKPVVATGTSGFFVRPDETGFLTPPGRPDLLAERVRLLAEDKGLRERFGRAGAERARSLCDLDRYGDRMADFYKGLV